MRQATGVNSVSALIERIKQSSVLEITDDECSPTCLRIIFAMAASLLSIRVAIAQEQTDSSPHLEFLQVIEGIWDYKMSFPNGEVGAPTTGVVNWARRVNRRTLRGYWTADDETRSAERLGYGKSDGTLVNRGHGEQGNHWNLILPEVTATSMKGRCIGTHPAGVSFEGLLRERSTVIHAHFQSMEKSKVENATLSKMCVKDGFGRHRKSGKRHAAHGRGC